MIVCRKSGVFEEIIIGLETIGNSLSSRNNINFYATIKLSVIKVEKVQCSFSIIRETCSSFPFSVRT